MLLASRICAGGPIGTVSFRGAEAFSAVDLAHGTFLRSGAVYSDSLLDREIARIDSLYFSRGLLAVRTTVDTIATGDNVDIVLTLAEGKRTRIGEVSVNAAKAYDAEALTDVLDLHAADPFDPLVLEQSMQRLLARYNDTGYPYAQVWLTKFDFRENENLVDIAISVMEGGEATVSNVIFEGLSRTDTMLALRTSRMRSGDPFRESGIKRAARYLGSSGLFESVGRARVSRRRDGDVNVVFPVEEKVRSNGFQGALGFSKKDGGEFTLNGSVRLDLRNIAGTGRNVHFGWLNDGEKYSRIEFDYRQPFVFGLPVHIDAGIKQIVQDTIYTWHSGGLYLGLPLFPGYTVIAGAAVDRNVPGGGELERSIRQRYRLGLSKDDGSRSFLSFHVEGAYKKNHYMEERTQGEGQFLYGFESSVTLPVRRRQVLHLRLVSEAVFSSNEIPAAERFSLGGARSVRGYRENQFRGERTVFTNIEYRFGTGGWLFLFDDTGAFYIPAAGWTIKNGAGFGLRSVSPLGIVALSFGVGERLSLEGTRIHISLEERF